MRLALLVLLAVGGCAAKRPKAQAEMRAVPDKAMAVIRTARSYLPEENHPVTQRRTPKDCSDFVRKVFAEHGMELPRTSEAMAGLGRRLKDAKQLRMGDLVFFSGEKVSRRVGHVGIYVNNGIFIHLSKPSEGVRMESLYNDYYRKRYLAARRLITD